MSSGETYGTGVESTLSESDADRVPRADTSGYSLTESDLSLMQVSQEDVEACVRRHRPLGMDEAQFDSFLMTLRYALKREGVRSADVRLQGSSARLFSSPHKLMPYSREGIATALLDERRDDPPGIVIDRIERRIASRWPSEPRPYQRPFDSFFRLEISPYPSDYDVQVSSDEAVNLIRESLRLRNVSMKGIESANANYRFIRKELSDQLLYLQAWAAQWEEELGRGVSVALFGSEGPPESIAADPNKSSHFRESDWVLIEATPFGEDS